MPLIAYNLTGAPVALTTVTPVVTLPASSAPPAPGAGVNVTSELQGLAGATYALLQTQSINTVRYVWTDDKEEYPTPGLLIWDNTQTGAALSLYVATTGSNTNDGLTVGTPLLTVQEAINRIPKKITHNVVVNMAAGTYVGDVIVGDFTFLVGTGSAVITDGASLTIQGPTAWTTATLGSGTATGTATAYTAPVTATSTVGTLTDSGQSWTVDALKGLFLLNNGTGTRKVILSNTATTIDVGFTIGTVTPGVTTYAIEKPAVVIQGSFNIVNNGGFSNVNNGIVLKDFEIQSVANTGAIYGSGALLYVANTKINRATSVYTVSVRVVALHVVHAVSVLNSTVTGFNSYWVNEVAGGGGGLALSGEQAFVTIQGTYIRVVSGTASAVSIVGGQLSTFLGNINVLESTGSGTAAVLSISSGSPGYSRVVCGIFRGTASKILLDVGNPNFTFGPASFYLEGTKFETGSVGIRISASSVCRINSGYGIPTFSGCTTELTVDTTTSTHAAFAALTPKKIVGDYGAMLVQY